MTPGRRPTLLALEDGSVFRGTGFGASGEAFGEAVFNTSMTGYQEVLTDPSYAGQIVTMTSPHQGNYGMNADDAESGRIQVAGYVVREVARRASSWRASGSLSDALEDAAVPGIEGVDTRRLTLRIREQGSMRAAISSEDLDAVSLVERVRSSPGMAGADLAKTVSTASPFDAEVVSGPPSTDRGRIFRVAAYDFGLKRTILRLLADHGIDARCTRPRPRRRRSPEAVSMACSFRTAPGIRRPPSTGSRRPGSCSARSRSSGSAWGISCSGWRSAVPRTR